MAAVIGWFVAGVRADLGRLQGAILLMCALWCGAIFVSFLHWNQQVEAPHGRLLFPVLGSFALLFAVGLARLPQPRIVLGVVVVGLLVLSFAAPLAYIRPAYAWPELFPPDQLADRRPQVASHNLQYGEQVRLIGVGLDRASAAPGEWLNVTLCWTAAHPITRNLTVFVHLLGRENLVVGARNTWPGLGRFPTSLWPAGRAFCDTIPVSVETTAPVPELYGIEAGWYEAETNDRLEAVDAAGQLVLPPVVDRVRIAPSEPLRVSPQHVTQADFGQAMLIGFDAPAQARPGERTLLRLYWRATATLPQDYTVFVHLLDGAGQPVVQADAEPRDRGYPTSAWIAGDVIPDDHVLDLPANLAPVDYVLQVGLYLAPNGPRLPLKPSGDAFALGVLRVMR